MNPRSTARPALLALLFAAACSGRLDFDPADRTGAPGATASGGGPGGAVATGNGGPGGGASTSDDPPVPGGADSETPEDAAKPVTGSGDAGTGEASVPQGDADMVPVAAACPAGFDVLEAVFSRKCGNCHGAVSPAKGLDLASAGLAARMVDKPSTCMNRPLIASQLTGDGRATGQLFDKLAGAVTGCGVRMPANAAALTPTELSCVNDWAVAAINNVLGK